MRETETKTERKREREKERERERDKETGLRDRKLNHKKGDTNTCTYIRTWKRI